MTLPPYYYLKHLRQDISAGIIVFLVALPLCLGIALASGAPLLSGVIAGIVGGVVVSWASGSQLSVSGPAAGIVVMVLHGIQTLGSYQAFLASVVVAGTLQMALGFLRAGIISAYFPAAVIKGMLAAVGLILILKQIPHAIGFDADFEGDETFMQSDAHTTLSEIIYSLQALSPGAIIASTSAIFMMMLWQSRLIRGNRVLSLIPGPILAVSCGVIYNVLTQQYYPNFGIASSHLVSLPDIRNAGDFLNQLTLPDFKQWANPDIYVVGLTLAVVASLETLLSLEAADKLDPHRRIAPTNRELKAQGLGNVLSGLIGGLPMTSVLVRTSTNIIAGGQSKLACFTHGVLLLISSLFLARFLNLIPLASLAAILIVYGYKLTRPAVYREMYRKGTSQIVPFAVTIIAILFSDLLTGIAVGMFFGLFYVIRGNFHSAVSLTQNGSHYLLRLQRDASFLNKAPLRDALARIDRGGYVIIDGTRARFIDQDILETIEDFIASAGQAGITVEIKKVDGVDSLASRTG